MLVWRLVFKLLEWMAPPFTLRVLTNTLETDRLVDTTGWV